MSAPLSQTQPSHDHAAPAGGVERYWYIPAGIAVLIYLILLADSPFLDLFIFSHFILSYDGWIFCGLPAIIFIIVSFKALIQMVRKPAWPEALMVVSVVANIYSAVILEQNNKELGWSINDLGWILLAIGYYGWGAKTNPGRKTASIPMAIQILLLAIGSGMLCTIRLSLVHHDASPFTEWIGFPWSLELAMVAVMVVGAIFRAIRVGAWSDWLQFAGLGANFILALTAEIIMLQLGPASDIPAVYQRIYIYVFVTSPGLLLFAIGFFAARPAPEAIAPESSGPTAS
jgi:hypothetical protein